MTTAAIDEGCTLREFQADNNYDGGVSGGNHYWGMETKAMEDNVMLWIDFSAEIPSEDTIDAASLYLNITGIYETGGINIEDYFWKIYRCRRADWATDEATFNVYKTGSNWGTPGCRDFTTDRYATPEISVAGTDSTGWWPIDVKTIVVENQADDQIFNVMMDGNQTLFGEDESIYYWVQHFSIYLSITHSSPGGVTKTTIIMMH